MTAALDRFRLLHPDEARHAAFILDTTHRMPIPSSPIVEETTIPRRTIPLRPQSSLFTRAASSGPTWSSLSSRLRLFPTPTHPTPRISGSVATLTDLPGADTPTRSDSPHPPDHTYPPDPAPGTTPPSTSDRSVPSIWSLPIPTIGSLHSVSGWLKAPRRIVTSLSEPIPSPAPTRRISEVLTSSVMIGEDGEVTGEGGYPPVRGSEEEREGDNEVKMKVAERFRMAFGLTPKEELVARELSFVHVGGRELTFESQTSLATCSGDYRFMARFTSRRPSSASSRLGSSLRPRWVPSTSVPSSPTHDAPRR